MTGAAPLAGWYPQPDGRLRYWDGRDWTAHVTDPGALPATATAYGSGIQDAPPGPRPPTPLRYAAAPVYAVAPKSAGLALLASFFLPGLGQFVNGEGGKGVGFLLAYLVGWASVFVLVGFVVVPAVWIWSMVDAYQSARTWNVRHGILG